MENNNQEIIYFDLNNWTRGVDYPNAEPFITWMGNDIKLYFSNKEWVKKNNLVVVVTIGDLSVSYNITATKKWVEENCPELLTKYSNFICIPEEDDDIPEPRIYGHFLEYSKENIGLHYDNSWWED